MNLPVFEMVIDPAEKSDVEVSYMALVDKPAIERNFMAFNEHPRELKFTIDTEQMIISGPAMIAGSLIYRKDDSGEYNVFFSKETIKEIALKFFKKGYQKNINLFHGEAAAGVTIFESFISDSSRGIAPMKGFEDVADGSWFISAKVENPAIWEQVKAGVLRGFSVEGIFNYVKKKGLSGTESIYSHFVETDFMEDIKDLWKAFKDKFLGEVAPVAPPAAAPVVPAAFKEYKTADGVVVEIDKLEVGGIVTVAGVPAPAGDFTLEDGTIVSCTEGGVIATVTPPAAAPEAPAAPDFSSQFADITSKLQATEGKFSEVIGRMDKAELAFKELASIVEKILALPTVESVTPNTFSSDKQVSKEARIAELSEMFSKLRKSKN